MAIVGIGGAFKTAAHGSSEWIALFPVGVLGAWLLVRSWRKSEGYEWW